MHADFEREEALRTQSFEVINALIATEQIGGCRGTS